MFRCRNIPVPKYSGGKNSSCRKFPMPKIPHVETFRCWKVHLPERPQCPTVHVPKCSRDETSVPKWLLPKCSVPKWSIGFQKYKTNICFYCSPSVASLRGRSVYALCLQIIHRVLRLCNRTMFLHLCHQLAMWICLHNTFGLLDRCNLFLHWELDNFFSSVKKSSTY